MSFEFAPAVRHKTRGRVALIGTSGSGKTYTALKVAAGLAAGGRIAVIDTEHGSASKYAGEPGLPTFDVLELTSFGPLTYVQAIAAAEKAGYAVIVIDSLSHAWMGKDGALEQVDKAAKASRAGNSFAAWRDVTPAHNALIDKIVGAKAHVVVTMRAKSAFVQEKDERTGKTVVRKVGMEAVQRDGMEYEFDVVGDMDTDHNLVVTKTRCPALDGLIQRNPTEEFGAAILSWLEDGTPAPEPPPAAPEPPASPAPTSGPGRATPAPTPPSPPGTAFITVVDADGIPHTVLDDGSMTAAMRAADEAAAPARDFHWSSIIQDIVTGSNGPLRDLRSLFNRIGSEEENPFRRTGAQAKTVAAFCDMILGGRMGEKPERVVVESVIATVRTFRDLAVSGTEMGDAAAWPHGEGKAVLLANCDAALEALRQMLSGATTPREEI